MIFDSKISSSGHIGDQRKDILILGKDPKDGIEDTTLAAKKEHWEILLNETRTFVWVCITI